MPEGSAHAARKRHLIRTLSDPTFLSSRKSTSSTPGDQSPYHELRLKHAGRHRERDTGNSTRRARGVSEFLLETDTGRRGTDKNLQASWIGRSARRLFFATSGGARNKHTEYEEIVETPGGSDPVEEGAPGLRVMTGRASRKGATGASSSAKPQRTKTDERYILHFDTIGRCPERHLLVLVTNSVLKN